MLQIEALIVSSKTMSKIFNITFGKKKVMEVHTLNFFSKELIFKILEAN